MGNSDEAPDFNNFYSAPIRPEALTSFKELDEELEMLKVEEDN